MMVGIDDRQPGLVISSCSCRHAVERMLNEAEAAYGIRHVVLRYFNAAGADPDRKLGNFYQPERILFLT
jgi:UDP-glucose 4-epimerase